MLNSRTDSKTRLDIIVPAFDEEANIAQFIEGLFACTWAGKYQLRLIIIDDGSVDQTATIVKDYLDHLPVTLIRFSRNFGKETAILAGLDHSDADACILMDADLQHPFSLIPTFIQRWQEGFKNIYALRENRDDESRLKRLGTRIFYALMNLGSDVKIVPGALDFRLLDRDVVRSLCRLREQVRFSKGLYAWVGFRTIGVPFTPNARLNGTSRFSIGKLAHLALDGITSFSNLPLQFASAIGGVVSIVSIGYALFIAAHTLIFGAEVPGWATLTVAITGLSGIQLLCLGVIGKYIGNINNESKSRPSYIIDEVLLPAAQIAQQGQGVPRKIADINPGFGVKKVGV